MLMFKVKSNSWAAKHYHHLINPEVLVETFLNIHSDWFSDPQNTLCYRRSKCKDCLLEFVKTGKDKAVNHNEIYVLNKFIDEFFNCFERFHYET